MRWRRWRWARRRNTLPVSMTVTNWGLRVRIITSGWWNRLECSGANRSGIGVLSWGDYGVDFQLILPHSMMNRPPKSHRDGVWTACLLWRALWINWQWNQREWCVHDAKWVCWSRNEKLDLPRLQVVRMDYCHNIMRYVLIESVHWTIGWRVDVSADIRRSSVLQDVGTEYLYVKSTLRTSL